MQKLLSRIFYLLIIFVLISAIYKVVRINILNNANSYILSEKSCETIQIIEEKEIGIDNNLCTVINLEFLYNLNIFDSNYVVKYKNNEFAIKKNSLISFIVID